MNVHRCLAALVLLLVGSVCHAATTQYYYDDLGRIVQAVRSDGAVFQYQYDANGNVVAINRISASSVSIAELTPRTGHADSSVTISGTGFSATPSQNTVTFSGAAQGTVTSASPTRLVVTVPQTAQNGVVSVAVGGNTAISAMSFIVRRPTILSFAPVGVAPGAPVTITGTNLNLEPGQATVTVNGVSVTVTSATNTKLVFTAPAVGSGLIHVDTPYGETTSTSNLIIVPTAVGAANVVSVNPLTVGSGGQSASSPQPGKAALFTFNGVQGQFITAQFTSISTNPSLSGIGWALFSPTNVMITSGSIGPNDKSLYLPKLAATGVYVLSFAPLSGSMQLTIRLDLDAPVVIDGGSLPVSADMAGQAKRAYFTVSTGDSLGFAVTDVSTPGGYALVYIYSPNGNYYTQFNCSAGNTPGCQVELPNLQQAGTYSILILPSSASTTMAMSLRLSRHVTGTLAIGTPQSVTLAPGQYAALSFTATAGESLAINASSIQVTPVRPLQLEVYAPNGTFVGSTNANSWPTVNLSSLAAGTYKLLVHSTDAATASVQLSIANAGIGSVPIDDDPITFTSTLPGQIGVGSFTASAGDNLGMAITDVSVSPSGGAVTFFFYDPSGNWLNQLTCSPDQLPGCQLELANLPYTGTYRIIASPTTVATMGFKLRLTRHLTGSLAVGTPQNVSLIPGQYGALSFTATAGQSFAINVSSIASTPSGLPVRMTVYAANGTWVGGALTNFSPTLNLMSLGAGTYKLVVNTSNAAPVSMQVSLAAADIGSVPIDGGTATFTGAVPGQVGVGTFTASAGDRLGLAVTGMSVEPSIGYVTFYLYAPDGNWFNQYSCSVNMTPGCQLELPSFTQTGTCKIIASPSNFSTMSFSLRLTRNATGTLVVGTPQSVSLQSGQYATLSFTATSGQTVAISAGSIATTPSGRSVTLRVFNPSGGQIGFSSSTTAPSVNLGSVAAGTYTVIVNTAEAATATMDVTLQ